MTVTAVTRNKNFSMSGASTDNEGDKWRVSFTLIELKRGHKILVRAKCESRRAPILTAPRDSNKILDLWPIQFWPEFAKPLATVYATGSDGTIQEGLFK